MKVLVACECSQVVMSAFRANGHDAWSCDIQDAYGDFPQFHLKGDVLGFLNADCDFVVPSLCAVSRSQRARSQTQPGVALAMANQWG